MSAIHSLVPARFLTLTAHLVIVITIFWSRDNNVRACLPLDYSQDEYRSQDTQLVVALSVTLGLFAIELAGFFSGASMFNSTQSLLCILFHTLPSQPTPVHPLRYSSFSLSSGVVPSTGGSLASAVLSLH
ncbi:transmembrane protein 107 isoform X6 [Brienomyrus brachyistius]|uniref:transmembrane protein 107 isoform X6 n=1 Tax=Brienomyrus brachyistius TaxID=42636 RepID=UPI0020B36C8E|nr:transmembrane protein 107 isoform X6 [Brienomyrus brachyistius]